MDDNPETWRRNATPKSFTNPLSSTVVIDRLDDANRPETYTIAPFQIVTYPTYLADYLITHLVDAVIDERGLGFVTPAERAKIRLEIEDIYGGIEKPR